MADRLRLLRLAAVLLVLGVAVAAGQEPTTPTRPVPNLADLLRKRLDQYQPWIDLIKQRSGEEIKKLQRWEYKVVRAETSDPVELTNLLNKFGEQGWECFHVASGAPSADGALPSEHLLFFRKRPGSWLAQVPLRDFMRLLMIAVSEGGETEPGP